MTRQIAVYGGSFDPPGNHHRRIVQELRGADYATAEKALEKSRWVIKKAIAALDR